MRLLIIDDNLPMRRTLKSFVADYADEILECSDGASAFDCYAHWLPDFVLMDVQMPRCDGITATREIKSEFPQAKILIVTNHDDPELREAAFSAGVSGYVLKENLLPLLDYLENAGKRSNELQ